MIYPQSFLKTLLLSGVALSLIPLTGFGLARILGGDFFVDARGGVEYDTNVTSSADGEEDFAIIFGPGFEYIRPDTRTQLRVAGTLEFLEFTQDEADDTVDWEVEASALLPIEGSPLTGSLEFSIGRTTESNSQVNTRIESLDIILQGNLTYQLRPKIALSSTATFDYENPEIFSQNTELSLRNQIEVVEIIGQLGGFAGVEFERQSTEGAGGAAELTNNNIAVLFGINGQLVPEGLFSKLDANLGFGFRTVNNTGGNGNDETIFVIDGSLIWQAREKTQVGVQGVRDIDLAPNDTGVINTNFNLFVVQEIGNRTLARAEIGYEEDDFVGSGRTDDGYYIELGAEFQANDSWSISAAWAFEDRESDAAIANFDRHLLTASTVYRF
ncbi:MAG: outer membrane beta-barrel protein [Opitutales bacterium]